MSAGSGPASPSRCDGRSSNGSSSCGKRSVPFPRSRRSMPTSGSGRNPTSSWRPTSSSSRRTVTCARHPSPASETTSEPRIESYRARSRHPPHRIRVWTLSDRTVRLLYGPRTRWGPHSGNTMAKLELTDVEIYVKDLKAARAFYTKKIGLKVRSSMPKWGYLALGATKGGEDAALTPWQPVPEWGKEMYESRLKMIGGVTGIGFITNDLKRTIADLKKKGTKTAVDGESQTFGRFTDPDRNVLLLAQPAKPKIRRAGVSALGFVTVASRDSKKTGEFFRKALGMRKQRAESDEEGFDSYQLSPKATAITPFTPRKDIYDNPADYDADMAHIGEETGIGFTTSGIYRLQEQLLAKGVRFKEKAEAQDWGGIRARFFDPDDNVYTLVEYKA